MKNIKKQLLTMLLALFAVVNGSSILSMEYDPSFWEDEGALIEEGTAPIERPMPPLVPWDDNEEENRGTKRTRQEDEESKNQDEQPATKKYKVELTTSNEIIDILTENLLEKISLLRNRAPQDIYKALETIKLFNTMTFTLSTPENRGHTFTVNFSSNSIEMNLNKSEFIPLAGDYTTIFNQWAKKAYEKAFNNNAIIQAYIEKIADLLHTINDAVELEKIIHEINTSLPESLITLLRDIFWYKYASEYPCLEKTLEGYTDSIRFLSTINENLIISAGSQNDNEIIKIWDIKSGECIKQIPCNEQIDYIKVLNESRILFGSCKGTIRLWNLDNDTCLQTFQHPGRNKIYCIAVDNNHIISSSLDKDLKIWDISNGECLHTIENFPEAISNIIPKENDEIVIVLVNGQMEKWNKNTGAYIEIIQEGTPDMIRFFHLNKNLFATGNSRSSSEIDLYQNGVLNGSLRTGPGRYISSVSIFDNSHIMTGNNNNTIALWNIDTNRCIAVFEGENEQYVIHCITALDSHHFAAASDELIDIYEVPTLEQLLRYSPQSDTDSSQEEDINNEEEEEN